MTARALEALRVPNVPAQPPAHPAQGAGACVSTLSPSVSAPAMPQQGQAPAPYSRA